MRKLKQPKRPAGRRRPGLLMLVHLPPPVHGISVASEAARSLFEEHLNLRTVNLSYGALTLRPRDLARYLAPFVRSAVEILRSSRAQYPFCYLAASGGRRLLLDGLLIALCKIMGRSAVIHHHSTAYVRRPYWLMNMIYRLLGSSDISIFLDAKHAAEFDAIYANRTRSYSISNASLLLNRVSVVTRSSPTPPPRIGFLSNLEITKGIDTFLALCEALRTAGTPVNAVVAGPFRDKAAETLVNAAVKAGDVRYLGAVYGKAKKQFFADIDLLVFPSRYVNETEPVVVLEAMAEGIPVIATKCGYVREILRSTPELTIEATEFLGTAPQVIAQVIASYERYSQAMTVGYVGRKSASDGQLAELIRQLETAQ